LVKGYPLEVIEELTQLPIAEADRLARQKIEHHRDEMGEWRRARAVRVAKERDSGRSVADIAGDMGVTQQVVYDLIREARKASVE
jgi:hypothetical protein